MRENKGKSIIALPADYIVIDVETTGLDYEYCEIIEVSAIRYSDGQRIDTFSSLVQPRRSYDHDAETGECTPCFVDDFITELTGITNEMLQDAPTAATIMPDLLAFLGDSILLAHNANFDINFLYDAIEQHCGNFLTNDFIDTIRIARKVFPDMAHHRLADVALACKVSQPYAHRAEADCLVTADCYEVMRNIILSQYSEDDFRRLFKQKSAQYNATLASIASTVDEIDDTNPIYSKIVVFTGALSSMPRREAFQIVANLGGIPEDSITKNTNYLVIGNSDFAQSVKEGKTKKMLKAESYQRKGADIAVLSENAFFEMISDFTSL